MKIGFLNSSILTDPEIPGCHEKVLSVQPSQIQHVCSRNGFLDMG
jgi:hypothetical protein